MPDIMAMATADITATASWVRPKGKYTNRDGDESMLPVPWISEDWVEENSESGWSLFDPDKPQASIKGCGLCSICGHDLPTRKVFIVTGIIDNEDDIGSENDENYRILHYCTAGTGMHARCAILSMMYCPALQIPEDLNEDAKASRRDSIFVVLDKPGHGMTEGGVENYIDSGADVIIDEEAIPVKWEQVQQWAKDEARARRAATK